jgi:hypothetical protein
MINFGFILIVFLYYWESSMLILIPCISNRRLLLTLLIVIVFVFFLTDGNSIQSIPAKHNCPKLLQIQTLFSQSQTHFLIETHFQFPLRFFSLLLSLSSSSCRGIAEVALEKGLWRS